MPSAALASFRELSVLILPEEIFPGGKEGTDYEIK